MAAPSAQGASGAPSRSGGLALAAAIVAFGFIGSRLLGVIRTMSIADAFGSSPELSAYFVAFRLPDLIFQLLAGATLASAFIPVFARLFRQEGEEAAWRLASNILNLVFVATAALCVVAFALAPVLVPLTAPGLGDDVGRSDEITNEAIKLTRVMLLSPLLFAVSGIITGILNGRQRFLLTALAPIVYNLSIIFGAFVLAEPYGVTGLAVSVVAGAALHLGVQVPGLVRERMRYRPSFEWREPNVREVGRLMGPRVIGLAAAQLNFVVAIYFASKINDDAIANLTFAFLLSQLPLALFAMSLSTAVFPRLAESAADGDMVTLRETVSRVLRVILFLTAPAAIGLALLRYPATVLLLERGEFSAIDSAVTAAALGWYCLAIVPQAGIEIHSRGFYAIGDTRTPVAFAVVALALNLVLSAVFWDRFELEGLAFSLAVSSWIEWLLLYAVFLRRTGAPFVPDFRAATSYAICGGVMAMFLALALPLLDRGSRLEIGVAALAGAVAGAAVYAGMAMLLRVPEVGEALSRLRWSAATATGVDAAQSEEQP